MRFPTFIPRFLFQTTTTVAEEPQEPFRLGICRARHVQLPRSLVYSWPRKYITNGAFFSLPLPYKPHLLCRSEMEDDVDGVQFPIGKDPTNSIGGTIASSV